MHSQVYPWPSASSSSAATGTSTASPLTGTVTSPAGCLNFFAPRLESIRIRFLPTKKNRLSWSLDREIRRGLVALIGRRSAEAEEEDEDEAGLSDKGSGGFRDLSLTARNKLINLVSG